MKVCGDDGVFPRELDVQMLSIQGAASGERSFATREKCTFARAVRSDDACKLVEQTCRIDVCGGVLSEGNDRCPGESRAHFS